MTDRKKLRKELIKIFDCGDVDLDFGIYRIINFKQKKIKEFIKNEITKDIKKQLKSLITKHFKEKSKDEKVKILRRLELKVYTHIIKFFSMYYDKEHEKYYIPYSEEDVLFYWKNKDKYYVKSGIFFRKYSFKINNLVVNLRVVKSEEEKGDVKSKDKKFLVLSDKTFSFDKNNNELNIYFEYRSLTEDELNKFDFKKSISQNKINKEIIKTLKEKIPKSLTRIIFENSRNKKTLIEKHLNAFTKIKIIDFFIHKDLKGFLEKELNFYIKNEFLNLDELAFEEGDYFGKFRLNLVEIKAFRNIALKIIEFLAQIENLQKKLWEKKKFIIDTHYVITLDKIKEYAGEGFLESILDEILRNEKQLKEWKELFGIKIKRKRDLIESNTLEGKEWRKLPIDTKYFNDKFKWKLLVALTKDNDLDKILDGILIKSENWQALNLLLNKYYEKVQTIYIDPPFKTGKDFIYKDNYQTSSWLTLLENRIKLGSKFLKSNGSFFIHLDWNANYLGRFLVNFLFSVINEIIWNTNATKDEEAGLFSYKSFGEKYVRQHDTIFQCSFTDNYKFIKLWKPNRNTTKLPIGWLDLISYPKEEVDRGQRLEDFRFFIEKYNGEGILILYEIEIEEKVFPIGDMWNDIYHFTQSELRTSENVSFNTQKPENLLRRILQSTTEKGDLIMDFFAGSGTTLIVAHKLKRKWIGVELEEYFDEFYHDNEEKKLGLLGRLKIVLHGDKEFNILGKRRKSHLSKYINWQGGGFFKYHTLEQYEDALENIEFEKSQKTFYELMDYFIKYILEWETKNSKIFLNLKELKDPFNYKLKIIENHQQKIVNVDIVETFNYLLGLNVSKYKVLRKNGRKYVFVFGKREEKRIAIVWRNIKDIDFEKDKEVIEGKLKDFKPDEIYINGEALVKGFRHIEPLFKSLMFQEICYK